MAAVVFYPNKIVLNMILTIRTRSEIHSKTYSTQVVAVDREFSAVGESRLTIIYLYLLFRTSARVQVKHSQQRDNSINYVVSACALK